MIKTLVIALTTTILMFSGFHSTKDLVKKQLISPATKSNCNCASYYCSCSSTCDNEESLDCYCGIFCNCICSDDASSNNGTVTMNKNQEQNSIETEKYLRDLNKEWSINLADSFLNLRTALKNKEMTVYYRIALGANAIFEAIPEKEKTAFSAWSEEQLEAEE